MYFSADAEARLVSPCFGNVPCGVASASQNKKRQVEFLDKGYAGTVAFDTDVEAAKSISSERVCAALENNGSWLVGSHTGSHDIFKELDVLVVLYAIMKRHIEGMVCTRTRVVDRSRIIQRASTREEDCSFVFMEGECHDAVCGPESLLDTIAVMDVNINVEYAWMVKEELEYGKNDVIDVAKARCSSLLSVMQSAGPVNCNVGLMVGELTSSVKRRSSVGRAVLVEAIEYGAVISSIIRKCLCFWVQCNVRGSDSATYLVLQFKVIGAVGGPYLCRKWM